MEKISLGFKLVISECMLIIISCQYPARCTNSWSFQELRSSCNTSSSFPSFARAGKIRAPSGSNQPWLISCFYLLVTCGWSHFANTGKLEIKHWTLRQGHWRGGHAGQGGHQRAYEIQAKRPNNRAKPDKEVPVKWQRDCFYGKEFSASMSNQATEGRRRGNYGKCIKTHWNELEIVCCF